MLKIVVVSISVIFSFLINVNAETIYGEYYRVDELNNVFSDELKIESYKVYNTYHLEYEDMGYLLDNIIYIKDENDYIEEDLISDNCLEDNLNYIDIYTSIMKTKKITLSELKKSLKIREIEIYYKDIQLNYEINDLEYFDQNILKLNDGNFDDFYRHNSPRYIELVLDDVYEMKDLSIVIYGDINTETKFKLYLDKIVQIDLNKNIDNRYIIKFRNDINDDEIKYSCLNKIRKYRYYKENIILDNNYVLDGDNLLLDDFKIINNYYKRDKLVLNNELVIDNKNKLIDDFIEYSSGEVFTDCNIDYDLNGKYNCLFKLNDIEVEKEVLVNIEDELVENVVRNNNEISSIYLNETNSYNSEDTNIKNINNLKENTNTKKEEKEAIVKKEIITTTLLKDKDSKEINNFEYNILFRILIILFSFIILVILLKRRRDNVESV